MAVRALAVEAGVLVVGQHGRLVQVADRLVVAPQVVEHLGRLSGYSKLGMPARASTRAPSATSTPPIHDASTGLPGIWACGTSASAVRVGSVIAWGVRMTSIPSDPGILGGDGERLRIPLRRRVADDVHGVAVAPRGRQHLVVAGASLLGQLGEAAAAADERVGGEHARAARVGDDGQVGPARSRLACQQLGRAEQVADAVHAQHAHAPERGRERLVGAGERPGVRRRGARRLGRPARA